MKRCSKCETLVPDESKICRVCGAIVDGPLAQAIEPIPEEATEQPLPPRTNDRPWRCPSCGEQIDATFEVCWSCGTSSDGTLDPSFVREEDAVAGDAAAVGAQDYAAAEVASAAPEEADDDADAGPFCIRCGSRRIIDNARLAVTGRVIRLVIDREQVSNDPGTVLAAICADCGRIEWSVANVWELYNRSR